MISLQSIYNNRLNNTIGFYYDLFLSFNIIGSGEIGVIGETLNITMLWTCYELPK